LIVSPFLSNPVIKNFLDSTDEAHLVSRPESLQQLPQDTLGRCASVRFLVPTLVEELDDDVLPGGGEVLDGLHAKLFVIDHGWDSSIFSGSFNATFHAFQHNVEFMVELVGKRSRFGVDEFLRQVKGETNFADLLQTFDVNADVTPVDATLEQLDDLIQTVKRGLAKSDPRLVVTAHSEKDLFDMKMESDSIPEWPDATVDVRAWPITQQEERGQPLGKSIIFSRLSYGGLTPLIAFSVKVRMNEKERRSVFVMNLDLQGAPEDRQDRVVRSLIENRDQFLRYILFLLACGDEATASSGDLRKLLQSPEDCQNRGPLNPHLLETLLRALHRGPEQLERVASLLDVLRKQTGSSELLSDDFQNIWEPIWAAAQQATAK